MLCVIVFLGEIENEHLSWGVRCVRSARFAVLLIVGSCATNDSQSRQVRKEATVRSPLRVM